MPVGIWFESSCRIGAKLSTTASQTTGKPRDLVRPGTHTQAGKLFCRGWENGMDTMRGVEIRKTPREMGYLSSFKCISILDNWGWMHAL